MTVMFRLYNDGRIAHLEAISGYYVAPKDPKEAQQAKAHFLARNRAVRRMLDDKGFTLDGGEHLSVAVNHYLVTGGDEKNGEPET